MTTRPPSAERRPLTITQLGRTRTDAYSWLKDENWQEVMKDPSLLQADIRAYLEAENAYTKSHLEDATADLRETLFAEMRGRIKEDDSSVPAPDGAYAYYTFYRPGGEYEVFARKPVSDAFNPEAKGQILFDGDAEGQGLAYFDIGDVQHSPDHKLIASAVDDKGSEFYTIRFRDAETGEFLPDTIENTTGDFVWGAGSDVVFWVVRDENGRPSAVYQRILGSSEDLLIYEEPDPGFFVGIDYAGSDKYILIQTGGHTTSEVYFFPAGDKNPEPKLIAARETDIQYSVTDFDDAFYILTNADGAIDFKIVKAPVEAPGHENWDTVVPHTPGTLILGIESFKDHLVRLERTDGLPRLVIRNRTDKAEHDIAFPEAAYDLGMSSGYEYNTTTLRFDYASPSTPDQVFDYDMMTRERVLRKTREVPSGHIPEDYVVERIMAPAHDGETIPVTLLRHKDTPTDGSAPLLLYGYGSYGITYPADFRTSRLSLVDRGFIYAIAHVRGSQAKGHQWYLDGKLEKKENTFKDYVSAGRHLVGLGYGAEGKVVGLGGSAGGLLMGAASNMDPELFAGIIAAVPFVDVLTTMSDESLPLTPPEWPEWGNPITDEAAYDTILAYSPIDQVSERPYPAMLITGGLTDPRVTYWEPAKWVANLRYSAPDAGPYFLRINMDAGHGGASGRFEGLKEAAIEYSFALAVVGKVDGLNLTADEH
ncbi:MAG: S9 family peptidase [Ponticaulis sp.]|nr:S9 family peptidase [Ponticaulis sp.]|tara:strand:+ start:40034 stop:42154 length:2121 start_codon:yes stop_codon:yes gene_type:complete